MDDNTDFEWLAILDFEATCERDRRIRPQEIIELPTVLLNVRTRERREFQRYVRPTAHVRLSTFCTELTGIEQSTVDAADEFMPVFKAHSAWLAAQTGGHAGTCFRFVTCGDWDLKTALPRQLDHLGAGKPPASYQQWCNIKHSFGALYGGKARGMMEMLSLLHMAHQGRHHSGIDDCRNIANVCEQMLDDGAQRGLVPARIFARSRAGGGANRVPASDLGGEHGGGSGGCGADHSCAVAMAAVPGAVAPLAPGPEAHSEAGVGVAVDGGGNGAACGMPLPQQQQQKKKTKKQQKQKHRQQPQQQQQRSRAPDPALTDEEQRQGVALVDIGVNGTSGKFSRDWPDVVERARRAGVTCLLLTGCSVRGSREAATLAAAQPAGVAFSTAGIHPHDAKHAGAQGIAALRTLAASSPHVVAIGECGLDFNRNFSPPATQEHVFFEQVLLAAELQLPLFLHEREAHERLLAVLQQARGQIAGGKLPPLVVHCFTGSRAEAVAYLSLGCYLSFAGTVCMERRGRALREEVLPVVPLERLMVETDAPFMHPLSEEKGRRRGRCEPMHTLDVARTVARVKGVSLAQVAAVSTANAIDLFRLSSATEQVAATCTSTTTTATTVHAE